MTNLQAIDLLKGLEQSLDDYCELNDEGKTAFRMAIAALELFGNSEPLPSAQPEKRTEERMETHACDCIERQAAIEIVDRYNKSHMILQGKPMLGAVSIVIELEALPSAQPEIIRCKDCKYAEVADKEDGQDGYTCQFHRGSIWFSGSYCSWAERRTDG